MEERKVVGWRVFEPTTIIHIFSSALFPHRNKNHKTYTTKKSVFISALGSDEFSFWCSLAVNLDPAPHLDALVVVVVLGAVAQLRLMQSFLDHSYLTRAGHALPVTSGLT